MVALVMPVRYTEDEGQIISEIVTDEIVFGRFCCEYNDFYLVSPAKLTKQIKEAEEAINRLEDTITESEMEIEEYRSEIRSLERRKQSLLVEREQSEPQTEPA